MDALEQWQLDAAIASLSSDGKSLARSLRTKLAKHAELRSRFEARTPAPKGELIFFHDETEIARLLLKPGGLPKLQLGAEPARELSGLTQATQAAERIAKKLQELIDSAPQLGLFGPRKA